MGQSTEILNLQRETPGALSERDRYYSLFQRSPIPTAIIRCPDLVYELSNPANQKFLNDYPVVGKSVRDIPGIPKEAIDVLETVLKTRKPFVGRAVPAEFVIDGEKQLRYVDTAFEPFFAADGSVERIMLTGTDVTDAVQAKQSAENEEMRLRQLLDTMPQIVWKSDNAGKVLYYNRRWWEYTGLDPKAYRHENALDAVHPEEREALTKMADTCYRAGRALDMNYRLRSASGEYRWHLGRLLPVHDENGKVTEWIGTATDIEDQKQTELALNEAVRSRQDLMNICGHELKTPLTSLRLQTQSARRRIAKGDPSVYETASVQKLVESCDSQIGRLVRLVDDMLDLTRISSGKMALNLERVSLSKLTLELLDRLADQIAAAGCRLETSLDSDVVGNWDHFRIEQVLSNLVANALRYGKGTPVSVRVAKSADGKHALLTVRDGGMGIAPENQQRIFQRFERAVSASEISGLGLGLYITSEIVSLHGGTIRVESEPGKGATFTVELPLQ